MYLNIDYIWHPSGSDHPLDNL